MHSSFFLLVRRVPLVLLLGSLLCSFAWGPTPPPAEKSAARQRVERRLQRLEHRLKRSATTTQQLRLRKKINRLDRGRATSSDSNWTWSILGFSFSLGGLFFLVIGWFVFPFSVFSLLFMTFGVAASIAALVLAKQDNERFGGKGLAIAGVVIGGTALLLFLLYGLVPYIR